MVSFVADVSTRKGRAVARAGLLLLAVILFVGGSIAAWRLAFGPLVEVWQSSDWVRVPVRIETVRLVAGLKGRQLEVRYRYRFEGRTYRSDRYGLYRWLSDSSALEEAYAELLYVDNTYAWVNPRAPGESLLNRDISWPVALMAVPACGMVFLGAALIWAAFVGARGLLREKNIS